MQGSFAVLRLLLLLISYGSFLLQLMPATGKGIVTAMGCFALGGVLLILLKIHKENVWKNKQFALLLVAAFIDVGYSIKFYHRWLPSSKLQAIAAMFRIPNEIMTLIGTIILSVLAVYFLYLVLQFLVRNLSVVYHKCPFIINLLFCFMIAVLIVVLSQRMIGLRALCMGNERFNWGVKIVLVLLLFLYGLFGRIIPAVFTGAGAFMLISTINVYVYRFRERLFEPVDVFSAGTAMNVAGNYSLLPIPTALLVSWAIFISALILLYCLRNKKKMKLSWAKRLVLLAVCVASVFPIVSYTSALKTYHWHDEGALFNGYILDFVAKFKEISAQQPEDYSKDMIAELASQYTANEAEENEDPPHIIVIMDEAFADLSVLGEFSTNQEVMPFVSSLKENTLSGYALASVLGGNTANSEYEFLTGNSMVWLSPNAVPYQQYIRSSTYSVASYLKANYGYQCVAMHPYDASGWNRPEAYGHLGFDESYFLDDFPQQNMIREYVSDQEMFEFLIDTYEAKKEDPLFIMGVTMQNHGDYIYAGENYTKHITIEDADCYATVEQYLSLIHETDMAVEYLINYFQEVEEDVVILFFGDHQPAQSSWFCEAITGQPLDTLEKYQKLYKVPFFVWTNYDTEEAQNINTSLNYLSNYVYDAAGITLPPYNRFLQQMEQVIPAINSVGFYSQSAGEYRNIADADAEEKAWLDRYQALQYNNIFDKANQDMFPALP